MAKKNKIKVSLTKNMTIFCRRNQSIIIKSVIPLIYSATSVNVVKLPNPNTGIGHKQIFFSLQQHISLCVSVKYNQERTNVLKMCPSKNNFVLQRTNTVKRTVCQPWYCSRCTHKTLSSLIGRKKSNWLNQILIQSDPFITHK